MTDPVPQLEEALKAHGFCRVKEGRRGRLCRAILKLQTLNLNRAVAVVDIDALPEDPVPLIKRIKKEVAYRSGFFPFFYGIGTQLVLVVSGPIPEKIDPERYVDKYDNQWSIIQSVFVVRSDSTLAATARTWGQRISGKYQDVIEAVLSGQKKAEANQSIQRNASTGSVSNFESPARRG